ncbi:gamma-glutamyl-hercynylcysteine sulfoxide hydrolase [Actinoplanes ianthinogenes]|uniref:Gamma-glutamyl-hercynylcysteine sulfoxide hydrolase n=1 Tax=Actinoplanes ianthinogenes TaxID=122358 RepID=A0ABN6CA30_9ACTN|nr:ergothioneine biosynthesis protein EgtC [Actinoplanes ianthinogenes]BCJ41449.1 gamma-glutamyl-hercynylcysteine sulfoxide hydrolase [Actinoplanes ianthinogenes]GGR30024.1 gamma-glutamyl-hercynylcysteine sulfoxide hydrolase [Actinoplanes ianthinogenes]
MCRHLAYLGPPARLADLLFDPPHALAHQAWAPRDMRGGGTINADGFGVGWFAGETPIRYRSAMPIWSDAALPALAAATTSGAILAAVRSATAGMPVVETAAAPFLDGRWLISHNGVVRGFPGSLAGLAAELPVQELLTLEAPTDSAALSRYIGHHLRAGKPVDEVVATLVAEIRTTAPGSRLNLLLTDGEQIIASTAGHSLSVRATAGAVLVASEPLDDDPAWRPVPDNHLLIATSTDVSLGEV